MSDFLVILQNRDENRDETAYFSSISSPVFESLINNLTMNYETFFFFFTMTMMILIMPGGRCFSSDLQQLVIALGWHQEASVLQLHLSVLQQVVEDRQDVPLGFLQPFQDQDSPLGRSPDGTLRQRHVRAGDEPLISVQSVHHAIGRAARERDGEGGLEKQLTISRASAHGAYSPPLRPLLITYNSWRSSSKMLQTQLQNCNF